MHDTRERGCGKRSSSYSFELTPDPVMPGLENVIASGEFCTAMMSVVQ